jgi:exopolyphosphatase / guanosine-5'-triphosphate,3'-diphosphate pyrophosphatase
MKLAAIDVGTNTTLLLLAEARGPQDITVLADRAEITRLGRGIGGDGRLGAAGIERTLAVLGQYAALAREHGAAIAAVGTEALRRAPNAGDFLAPAAASLGAPVEVIDGEREAALSYRAAATSFPAAAAGRMVVADIGGGSTEIICSEAGAISFRASLPLGSVRLTERHVRHDPPAGHEVAAMQAEVREKLEGTPLRGDPGAPPVLIGTAGTVTSLAAMAQRLGSYDAGLVHGYPLTLTALDALVEALGGATQAERERMPGLDPRRADVIVAGACILVEIARRAAVTQVVTSDRGLRWGLLHERLAAAGRLAGGRAPG